MAHSRPDVAEVSSPREQPLNSDSQELVYKYPSSPTPFVGVILMRLCCTLLVGASARISHSGSGFKSTPSPPLPSFSTFPHPHWCSPCFPSNCTQRWVSGSAAGRAEREMLLLSQFCSWGPWSSEDFTICTWWLARERWDGNQIQICRTPEATLRISGKSMGFCSVCRLVIQMPCVWRETAGPLNECN